jgi:hypothetical protein
MRYCKLLLVLLFVVTVSVTVTVGVGYCCYYCYFSYCHPLTASQSPTHCQLLSLTVTHSLSVTVTHLLPVTAIYCHPRTASYCHPPTASYCHLLSPTHCQLLSLTVSYCHPLTAGYVPVVCIPAVGTFRLSSGRFCGFSQSLQHVPLRTLSWTRTIAVYSLVIHRVFRHCALGALGDVNKPRMVREVNHSLLHSHFQSVSLSPTRPHCPIRSLSLSHSHIYL